MNNCNINIIIKKLKLSNSIQISKTNSTFKTTNHQLLNYTDNGCNHSISTHIETKKAPPQKKKWLNKEK